MKNLRTILFGCIMLFYIGFLFNMIGQTEQVLKKGAVYRFLLEPIDPYDAFRGRYVRLFYAVQTVARPPDFTFPDNNTSQAYATLRTDSAGYAALKTVHRQAPRGQDYLPVTVYGHASEDSLLVYLPENLVYYYMNEKTAPTVENLVLQPLPADSLRTVRASVDVRTLRGKAIVEMLYINDLPVQEYLRQHPQ